LQVHFIINPSAGNGRGIKTWHQFEQQLQIPYKVHWTQYAGHTVEIAHHIASQATVQDPVCLIAIGGDGTIHEVLNGAANYENVYIGAISAGSGNDFKRGFASFESAKQIEQFVTFINTTSYDYGVARFNEQSRLFVNNFGIGFDALVAIKANESKLKKILNRIKLGKLSYVYFVISALFTFKPFRLTILQNGQKRVVDDVWFVTISNQPYFGGGMNLSPSSNTSDGEFEVTIVSNLSKWKLLLMFGSVFFAKHTNMKEVHQFVCTEITLTVDEQMPTHADGEKQLLNEKQTDIHISAKHNGWKLAK
jgi:diacylglycerol kinase (ATP)